MENESDGITRAANAGPPAGAAGCGSRDPGDFDALFTRLIEEAEKNRRSWRIWNLVRGASLLALAVASLAGLGLSSHAAVRAMNRHASSGFKASALEKRDLGNWAAAVKDAERARDLSREEGWFLDFMKRGPVAAYVNSLKMTMLLFRERDSHSLDRAFYVGKHEVTYREFRAFLSLDHRTSEEWREIASSEAWENAPVTKVTFLQACEFADWLTLRERAKGMLSPSERYRLPTEEEWTSAAGGASRLFPWGDEPWSPSRANLKGDEDGHETAAVVGSYPEGSSPVGCLDMLGNVWEWCCRAGDAEKEGPGFGIARSESRPMRGWSWLNDRNMARISSSREGPVSVGSEAIGFRLVRTIAVHEEKR